MAQFATKMLEDSPLIYAEAPWMQREFISDEQTWRPYFFAKSEMYGRIPELSLISWSSACAVT